MANYVVNITGAVSSDYGYVTINGTKISTTGTYEYNTPPTIAVFVSANLSSANSECKITLDGEVVQQGSGSYTINKTANVFDINIKSTLYTSGASRGNVYSAEITTTVTDPMTPNDGHNTNIGQVARQIEAGTVLFGGASREIESGLTLVGGVQRVIIFGVRHTLNITGDGGEYAWVEVGGTIYRSAETVSVKEGATVNFYAKATTGANARIFLNGSLVTNGGDTTISYTMVMEPGMSVDISVFSLFSAKAGTVRITTS